ncbi:MAG: FAD/NAD(P)-binding protein [Gammaproteobacteria bacterium]|nr:FAD/NAD(P)-binding protein [Gammaproteobacteria bacterium]
MRDYTIGIIGGGASGVALAARMVESLPVGLSTADLSIVLFDARGFNGGNAYAPDVHTNLMNTTCGAVDRNFGGAFGLLDWAQENATPPVHGGVSSDGYLPRPVVGEYLSGLLARTQRHAAARGLRFDLVQEEVVDTAAPAEPEGNYTVCTRAGNDFAAEYLYLALGHLEPARTEAYQYADGYFHNAYPIRRLVEEIPKEAKVGVLGTRLTAIDVALGLVGGGHTGAIHCVSRRGQLPSVRADRGKYTFRQLEREDLVKRLAGEKRKLSLPEVAEMLGQEMEVAAGRPVALGDVVKGDLPPIAYYEQEIALAKGRARPWQAVLYATNRNIDLLWHHLAEDDKHLLMSEWLNDWLTYRASIPRENAERILKLMKAGQLTVQGGAQGLRWDRERRTFGIERAGGSAVDVDYLVSATGSANRIEDADSVLVRNLLNKGLIVPHRYGGIDCVFETGQVISRDDAADGEARMFALGPITSGVYFFTTALEIIERQATQRTRDLAFTLGVEWLERPETEAWVDARQADPERIGDGADASHDEGPDLLERLVLSEQTRLIDFEQLRLLNDQIKGEATTARNQS